MSKKSGVKNQYWKVQRKKLQDDEFFIYSIVSKQSSSGLLNNPRLLCLDSITKQLRYHTQIPKQEDFPLQQLPSNPKRVIRLNQKNNKFIFAPTKINIGNAQVKWFQNKKNHEWSLTFISNQVMNQWTQIVYQVKQDTYKKCIKQILQPKKIEKSVDVSKYQTDFIKETRAMQIEKNSKISGVGNNYSNLKDEKLNGKSPDKLQQSRANDFSGMWLSEQVQKKEKLMINELAKRHMNSNALRQDIKLKYNVPTKYISSIYDITKKSNQQNLSRLQHQQQEKNRHVKEQTFLSKQKERQRERKFEEKQGYALKQETKIKYQQQNESIKKKLIKEQLTIKKLQRQKIQLELSIMKDMLHQKEQKVHSKKYQRGERLDVTNLQRNSRFDQRESYQENEYSYIVSQPMNNKNNKKPKNIPILNIPKIDDYQPREKSPENKNDKSQGKYYQIHRRMTEYHPTAKIIYGYTSRNSKRQDFQLQQFEGSADRTVVGNPTNYIPVKKILQNNNIKSSDKHEKIETPTFKQENCDAFRWFTYQGYAEMLNLYNSFCEQCRIESKQVVRNGQDFMIVKQIAQSLNNKGIQLQIRSKLDISFNRQQSWTVLHQKFNDYQFLFKAINSKRASDTFGIKIMIPFCCIVQYCESVILFKATIPNSPECFQADPRQYIQDLEKVEDLCNIYFNKNSYSIYKIRDKRELIIDNIVEYIPKFRDHKFEEQFPTQFILSQLGRSKEPINVHKINELQQIYVKIVDSIDQNTILSKLQLTTIICSKDLQVELNKLGYSLAFVRQFYARTIELDSSYLRRVFGSQLCLQVSIQRILRLLSTANQQLQKQKEKTYENVPNAFLNNEIRNSLFLDQIYIYIGKMISDIERGQVIQIVRQVYREYKINIKQEQVQIGYLTNGIIDNFHVSCQFQQQKMDHFSRNNLLAFRISVKRFELSVFGQQSEILLSKLEEQPIQSQSQFLIKAVKNSALLKFDSKFQARKIKQYLCYFISPKQTQDFDLQLFEDNCKQPPSAHSHKISLLAMKWHIKKNNHKQAQTIFRKTCQIGRFWSPFCPYIIEFIDVFSLFMFQNGKIKEAIEYAQLSVEKIASLCGQKSLIISNNLFQLGQLYFKTNRLKQALAAYTSTLYILQTHQQQHLVQYTNILLKIAKTNLNLQDYEQSKKYTIQALKFCQEFQHESQLQIQTFSILSRVYELTKKHAQLLEINTVCIQKFHTINNNILYQKILRMYTNAQILNLNPYQRDGVEQIFRIYLKKQRINKHSDNQAYSFLKSLNYENIMRFKDFCINALDLSLKFKKSLTQYRSFKYRYDQESLLIIFEAIVLVVGQQFFKGLLFSNQ